MLLPWLPQLLTGGQRVLSLAQISYLALTPWVVSGVTALTSLLVLARRWMALRRSRRGWQGRQQLDAHSRAERLGGRESEDGTHAV